MQPVIHRIQQPICSVLCPLGCIAAKQLENHHYTDERRYCRAGTLSDLSEDTLSSNRSPHSSCSSRISSIIDEQQAGVDSVLPTESTTAGAAGRRVCTNHHTAAGGMCPQMLVRVVWTIVRIVDVERSRSSRSDRPCPSNRSVNENDPKEVRLTGICRALTGCPVPSPHKLPSSLISIGE